MNIEEIKSQVSKVINDLLNDHPQKKPPGGRRKLLPTAPALFGRGIIDDDKQMGRRCLKPAAVRAQSSTSSFPS